MRTSIHKPVLLQEAIEYLNPQPGNHFIDCTLGGGGYAQAILQKTAPNGRLLALDADSGAIKGFERSLDTFLTHYSQRVTLVNGNFRNLKSIYESRFHYPISGIVADLGLSSDQLEVSGRGFTFKKDEPLIMSFSSGNHARLTATHILRRYPAVQLEALFRLYGEEALARNIAHAIVEYRKKNIVTTTQQLSDIVIGVYKERGVKRGRIHPATKVFQALRMAVNDELAALREMLPQALTLLRPKARLAVISFHGLEDRIVKLFFKHHCSLGTIVPITKKPTTPSHTELLHNPRARSAKLRVVEKK